MFVTDCRYFCTSVRHVREHLQDALWTVSSDEGTVPSHERYWPPITPFHSHLEKKTFTAYKFSHRRSAMHHSHGRFPVLTNTSHSHGRSPLLTNIFTVGSPICLALNRIQSLISDHFIGLFISSVIGFNTAIP